MNGYPFNRIYKSIRSQAQNLTSRWSAHHKQMQKDFNNVRSVGGRETGWSPFKKK